MVINVLMYITYIDINHQRYGVHTDVYTALTYRVFSAIIQLTAAKAATNRKTGRHRINRFSRGDGHITWWKSVGGAAHRRTCQIVRSNSSRIANSTTSPTEHRSGLHRKVNIGYLVLRYRYVHILVHIIYKH